MNININTHTHKHKHKHTHTHTHTHSYTYIYINTHTHTHIFLILALGPKMSRAAPGYGSNKFFNKKSQDPWIQKILKSTQCQNWEARQYKS